jgi:uncharacterized membrane protein YvbJ
MFCSECGSRNRENARFCNACGESLLNRFASSPKDKMILGTNELRKSSDVQLLSGRFILASTALSAVIGSGLAILRR